MTTEAQKDNQPAIVSPQVDPKAPEPKVEPPKKVEAKVEPKVDPAPGSPIKGSTPASPTESRARALKEEDDIPEDVELLELTPRALKSRLTRHAKSELRSRFGTDDVDQIKADLEELKTLREEKETARRSALDEKTRLEEDLAREKTRAEAAERRAQAVTETRLADQAETRIVKLAAKYIDEDDIEDQLPKLARHLAKTHSTKQLAKLKDDVIEDWFKELVKNKPKLAKDYEAKAAEKATKEDKPKVAFSNGPRDKEKPAPGKGDSLGGKTFAPGKPNSMSTAEAKEAARKEGYSW